MNISILSKPVRNSGWEKYYDWMKSGQKTYEGRLYSKIEEWDLYVGKIMYFYDQDFPDNKILVKIRSLPIYCNFDEAFYDLGFRLIPNRTKREVINMYNELFHYNDEKLLDGVTSKMINDHGVVAIGFIIIE